jgi:uroporphyrin-3 C-methyltransferase
MLVLLAAATAGALALAYFTQQRMKELEAEVARRQQDSAQAAAEARVLARQAETAAREAAAKMALLEARVAETSMQRSQFEDLLQSMARSRDENVLADVEAALRVAQQQAAITGSAEPLLAVLRQADERLARYAQPRLERVRRAIAQDLERTRAAGNPDIAVLAVRLDDLIRQVDDLPLLALPPQVAAGRRAGTASAAPPSPLGTPASGAGSAAPSPAGAAPAPRGAAAPAATTREAAAPAAPAVPASAAGPRDLLDPLRQSWARLTTQVWNEARSLLRVTRIEQPEAMLVAPEQTWFLRENLKLRLLNARLALLSRQFDTAQSDLRETVAVLERYFDRSARRTQQVVDALRQVMVQSRSMAVPRPDATLAAIAAAAAGR